MACASCRSAPCGLDSAHFRHVCLSVAIEDPLDRPSGESEEASKCWYRSEWRCTGRRAWKTYRDDVLPHVQFLRSVIEKYAVERLRVLQLTAAFGKWKRRSQIQTAQSAYHTLVLQHRTYYLRKALLRHCWDTLVRSRFAQWRAFTAQSARALLALLEGYERHCTRLALAKWYHRVVRVERLEEEAFARVLVRQQRQQDQAVVRKLRRRDTLLLVSVWVHWQMRTRKWACRRAPRRLRFQIRSIFVQWTRFAAMRKYERVQRWQSVRALVQGIVHKTIDVAHSKQAVQTSSSSTSTRAAMLAIEQLVSRHQRRAALRAYFQRWRRAASSEVSTGDAVDSQQQQLGTQHTHDTTSLTKFDRLKRFSMTHRAQSTRVQASSAARVAKRRPQWR